MIIPERFAVVVVPFPFTDLPVARHRPALIISGEGWNRASGHIVCAMITAARRSEWPLDVRITDLAQAGLTKSCVVRMKLFTIDAALVIRRTGQLGDADSAAVIASLDVLSR